MSRGRAAARLAPLVLLTVLVLAPAALARGWSRPVRLATAPLDPTPPALAFAPTGGPAVASAFVNADGAAAAHASLAVLSGGRVRSRTSLGDRREVLDLGWFGGAFVALAGTSGSGRTCCQAAELLAPGRHGYTATKLVRGLTGVARATLLAAGRATLATVADATGVWVAQAPSGLHFGAPRRLTTTSAAPEALATAALRGGRTLVAWLAGSVSSTQRSPAGSVVVAFGSARRAPAGPHTVFTLPSGHIASQLVVAAAPRVPTLAWIDEFVDSTGAEQMQVSASDLSGVLRPRSFAATGTVSGLGAAADAGGDEILVWKTCDVVPVCQVMAVTRPGGRYFGLPFALGTIDAADDPAVAMSPGGAAVIGWVKDGRVLAAGRASAGGAFGAPTRIGGSGAAGDLTLAAGPRGQVLAAWSDGTAPVSMFASDWAP